MSVALEEVSQWWGGGGKNFTLQNMEYNIKSGKKTTVNSSQFLKRKCSKIQWKSTHWEQLYQNECMGFAESFQPHPFLEWAGKSWTWVTNFCS